MAFDGFTVFQVWLKGKPVSGYDPSEFRQDDYGSFMQCSAYGDRSSIYGWEIDHIVPQSKEGTDDILNLRPLNWNNNARRQDGGLFSLLFYNSK